MYSLQGSSHLVTSSHVLNDCIMAQLIRKAFLKYFEFEVLKYEILYGETYFEFFWWDSKSLSHGLYKEYWVVWAETRRHAHQCDFLHRFNRFGPFQFATKTTTAFRKAAEVAFHHRFSEALVFG